MGTHNYYFFFQAEDGIRDLTVTGVQTCALPISDDDVGDGEPAPRPQHAERFGKDAVLVRREIDDTVGDDDVDGPVGQRDVLDLASQELDVLDVRLPLVVSRQREHLVGHVQPVRLARRPYPLGGQEDVDASTRAEVQHRLPWPEVGERRRVAAAERRGDRLRGKPRRLADRVEDRRERGALAPARRAPAADAAAARDPLSRLPVLLLDDLLEGLVRHAVPPPIESSQSYLDNSISVKAFITGRAGRLIHCHPQRLTHRETCACRCWSWITRAGTWPG